MAADPGGKIELHPGKDSFSSSELAGIAPDSSTEQQDHNDDDEKESDRAAANKNGAAKDGQEQEVHNLSFAFLVAIHLPSIPIAFGELVGIALLFPARGNPHGVRVRRQLPVAGHPFITIVAP
jgi:hypothetical protein